jgi:DNA-binding IclR family transcriptional regulator
MASRMTKRRETATRADKGEGAENLGASERYLVPALIRGLSILQDLSGERRRMTLSEVAASLKVTRSSAYRLLFTLSHLGFVLFDTETKTYALGPEVLRLGYGYLAARDLVEVATPHLVRLRDRTGWSAHLGELQGRDVVYLARVATRRSIASTVHVGTRLPARATTMGRILLSGLSPGEVRELYRDETFAAAGQGSLAELIEQLADDAEAGVVVQNSGYEPGVASIAAPIHDMSGRVVAAVNISAVALLTSDAELNGPLKVEVIAAAQEISRDLGHKAAVEAGRPMQTSRYKA